MNPDDLAEVLRAVLARGFEPPLTFAIVSKDGAILAGRYVQEGDTLRTELLAEYNESGVMRLPINMMLTDDRGEAARVVFTAEGIVYN